MSTPENPEPSNSPSAPTPKRTWISDLLGLPPKKEKPKPTEPQPAEPEDHSATEIQYDSEGHRLPPPTDEDASEDTNSTDT